MSIMKRTMNRRVCAAALALLLGLILMPPAALADSSVVDIDLSGTLVTADGYTVSGDTIALTGGYDYRITGSTSAYHIIVPAGVCDVTLDDASINAAGIGAAIHIYSGAAVNLTLEGVNILQSATPYGGIDAAVGTTLVITEQSTGKLTATGGFGGAGIGGGAGSDSGTITINGGEIVANSGTNAAGIGGGMSGAGGNIAINGGTVTANGDYFSAGIGGGYTRSAHNISITGGRVTAIASGAGIGGYYDGSFMQISISGGIVYAQGGNGLHDIGSNINVGVTFSLSGTAAVFLARDMCIAPVTTTHTHETTTEDATAVYGLSVPDDWMAGFGMWLRMATFSYNANGGEGTMPDPVTQATNATTSVQEGSALTRTYYTFSGWNTAADGSGTSYAAGDSFTFLENTTLYAQWLAHPELTPSVAGGTVYTGARITLTPNIEGGEWTFDSAYLSREGSTFTALKAGTSTITYTVDGVSTDYEVTIEASELPSTGQSFAWVWVLCGAALMIGATGIFIWRRRASKKTR